MNINIEHEQRRMSICTGTPLWPWPVVMVIDIQFWYKTFVGRMPCGFKGQLLCETTAPTRPGTLKPL